MSESDGSARPRQLTMAGWFVVVGSVMLLITVYSTLADLNSVETRDRVTEWLSTPTGDSLGLSVADALSGLRAALMVSGLCAAASARVRRVRAAATSWCPDRAERRRRTHPDRQPGHGTADRRSARRPDRRRDRRAVDRPGPRLVRRAAGPPGAACRNAGRTTAPPIRRRPLRGHRRWTCRRSSLRCNRRPPLASASVLRTRR